MQSYFPDCRMGSRRGLVVSVVSFYLVDLPSNPAKVYSFYSVQQFVLKQTRINKKEAGFVPFFEKGIEPTKLCFKGFGNGVDYYRYTAINVRLYVDALFASANLHHQDEKILVLQRRYAYVVLEQSEFCSIGPRKQMLYRQRHSFGPR